MGPFWQVDQIDADTKCHFQRAQGILVEAHGVPGPRECPGTAMCSQILSRSVHLTHEKSHENSHGLILHAAGALLLLAW